MFCTIRVFGFFNSVYEAICHTKQVKYDIRTYIIPKTKVILGWKCKKTNIWGKVLHIRKPKNYYLIIFGNFLKITTIVLTTYTAF